MSVESVVGSGGRSHGTVSALADARAEERLALVLLALLRGASALVQPDSSLRLSHFYTGQMNFLRKHRGSIASPVARLALLIGSVLRHRWRTAWVAVSLPSRP